MSLSFVERFGKEYSDDCLGYIKGRFSDVRLNAINLSTEYDFKSLRFCMQIDIQVGNEEFDVRAEIPARESADIQLFHTNVFVPSVEYLYNAVHHGTCKEI